MWFPGLAERWHIMPWHMRQFTPYELSKLREVAEAEARAADNARRQARRRSRGR